MNFKKLNLPEVSYHASATEIQNNTPFISIGNNVFKLIIFSVKTFIHTFPISYKSEQENLLFETNLIANNRELIF